MVSLSPMNLQSIRSTPASPNPEPKSRPPRSDSVPATISEPDSTTHPRKFKSSSQLNRWSMARALRSGRKLDRPVNRSNRTAGPTRPVQKPQDSPSVEANGDGDVDVTAAKSIYMVSDGTGWTAEHYVNAALGQFEHCLVDRGCPVNTHLFSGIEDGEKLMEIIKQAAKEGAMLVYTLADPSMAESAKKACKLWNVPATDILGPITDSISSHLGVTPSGLPRSSNSSLNEEYFRRIEAIEFTIKQDDGALPKNLHKADIVLVGVSRTGKTPLSTYLAQKGYKVANIPIVRGLELPRNLFKVDPRKVFGLTIDPVVLQAIREARAKSLGFGLSVQSNYSEMDCVREELEFARKIFAQNPVWPVIEVTERAIEETAAVILRLYHDKQWKCSMPRISKRY